MKQDTVRGTTIWVLEGEGDAKRVEEVGYRYWVSLDSLLKGDVPLPKHTPTITLSRLQGKVSRRGRRRAGEGLVPLVLVLRALREAAEGTGIEDDEVLQAFEGYLEAEDASDAEDSSSESNEYE
jgi:hypothetical protein